MEINLFVAFIFLKQFYIFSSGGLQVGDIFLITAFGIYLIKSRKRNQISVNKIDIYIFMFTFFVFIINLFYALKYGEFEFMLSTAHYIYNVMIIIFFREISKAEINLYKILGAIKITLVLQFIIYFLKIGRYYAPTRYMGTFNDPNQMGFYIYALLLLMILIKDILKVKINSIYFVIGVMLIFATSSTGMFLALASLIGFYILFKVIKYTRRIKFNRKKLIKVCLACLVIFLIMIFYNQEIRRIFDNTDMVQRVEEKFNRSQGKSQKSSNSQDRGLDKLLIYPKYILFGAGQGKYNRFSMSYSSHHEIHSTLPSILFYYGIFPTGILCVWIYRNIRKVPFEIMIVYASLITESFILLNQRQPFFWMIFVLGSLYERNNKQGMQQLQNEIRRLQNN